MQLAQRNVYKFKDEKSAYLTNLRLETSPWRCSKRKSLRLCSKLGILKFSLSVLAISFFTKPAYIKVTIIGCSKLLIDQEMISCRRMDIGLKILGLPNSYLSKKYFSFGQCSSLPYLQVYRDFWIGLRLISGSRSVECQLPDSSNEF